MCKLSNLFKKKTQAKPAWVTQSKRKVAKEEIYAASIHMTYINLLEEDPAWIAYGDREWHEHWHKKHMEAAYFTCPEYCKEIGIV